MGTPLCKNFKLQHKCQTTWFEQKKRVWIWNSNLTTFIIQTKHARISFKLLEYIVSDCLNIVAATMALGVSHWARKQRPSSSHSRARSCSCRSTITTDEGGEAPRRSTSEGRHHNNEASLDKHWHRMKTHLASDNAWLEAPVLTGRWWATVTAGTHTVGASTVVTPTSHHRQWWMSFRINGGERRLLSNLTEDLSSKVSNLTPRCLYHRGRTEAAIWNPHSGWCAVG
jgi:hypothetical protein